MLFDSEGDLLYAKFCEDMNIYCRSNGVNRWTSFVAGIRLWSLLVRQGSAPGWKHILAPFTCTIRNLCSWEEFIGGLHLDDPNRRSKDRVRSFIWITGLLISVWITVGGNFSK